MLKKKIKRLLFIALAIGIIFTPIKALANEFMQPYILNQSCITYSVESNKETKNILLYNTHTLEKNSDTTVIELTKNLAEKLQKRGYNVTYIDKNFSVNYNNAYYESNEFLSQMNLSDYDLIIDMHIDALNGKVTTDIDGKDNSKLMFVFSRASSNYNASKEMAQQIKDCTYNKSLWREDWEYNKGINNFNSDLSSKLLLIENGFNTNTKLEGMRANTWLAHAIDTYFNTY